MIKKRIHSQDSHYKLGPVKSGETSINLSSEILDLISPHLLPGEDKEVSFRLHKEDFIKGISFISSCLPLYKSSSTNSTLVELDVEFFSNMIAEVNALFGANDSADYIVNLKYRSDGRVYLNNLNVNGFNIRHFLVEEKTTMTFDMGTVCDLRLNYGEQEYLIKEKVLKKFCKDVILKLHEIDLLGKFSPHFTKSRENYLQVECDGKKLYRLLNPNITDADGGVRWFDDVIKVDGTDFIICGEWTVSENKSNVPSFSILKALVESLYEGHYELYKEDDFYYLREVVRCVSASDVNILANRSLQQIYYGAPGTGKSHKVKEITSKIPKENVFRTTFHPDSDYSTFVGCYKPITKHTSLSKIKSREALKVEFDSCNATSAKQIVSFVGINYASFSSGLIQKDDWLYIFQAASQSPNTINAYVPLGLETARMMIEKMGDCENQITYEFVPQVFTCAYVAAWNKLIPASGTGTTHSVPVPPSIPTSNNSSPFGDCSLADPLREDFKYDLDGYTVSPLISKDEDLLKQIDSLQFPFEGYGCLGELHDVTTVVLSNQTPVSKIQKNRKDLQKMIANARTGNKDFGILGQNAYAQVVNEDFGILGQLFDLKGIIKQKLEDSKGELIDFEYSLLGEYRDGKVYLYVEAIRSAFLPFEKLLAAVYVHEMMHAYFKTSEVVTEVEEAIVECCTLSFLDRFDAATGNKHHLNSSYKYDLERKVFVGLGHYAFGAYLYEHQSLNWMDMYKGVHVNRSAASGYVGQFAQIYPIGEEKKTMRMLYGLLNSFETVAANGDSTDLESDRVALVIEEINRGNCAQIFGDIFQLLDRDKSGYSEYPILADKDLAEYLMYAKDENGEDILKNKKGIEGGKLCLPPNLSILATMNTSDQSLFPIDSAFKRRWDWTYMPIDTKKESWKINIGKGYSWSSFLEKVNFEVEETTSSEDKMLGFYFCKADGGVVSKETFVGKVLFYIYNDVFKDYDHNRDFFIDKDTSKKIRFKDFYKMDGSINEPVVEKLLKNLKVESFEPEESESGETE